LQWQGFELKAKKLLSIDKSKGDLFSSFNKKGLTLFFSKNLLTPKFALIAANEK